MQNFDSEEELASTVLSENTVGASFLLGIDGNDGVGKTTLANAIAPLLNALILSLDDHIEKHKDGYVPFLRIGEIRSVLAGQTQPLIVEGVCLLAAAERIGIRLSRLVYIKRISYGEWSDEGECNPPEDVEEFLRERGKSLNKFAHLKSQLGGTRQEQTDDIALSEPRKEIIRYHAKYKPSHEADYVFLR